jgi:TIR domain-containing protein
VAKFIISYRREDSDLFAGRVRDDVAARFGSDSVFIDVDDIPLGKDFRVHIQEVLAKADAVLVVIGPKWLGPLKGGQYRIKEEGDPVRIEVETALKNGIETIPLLVGRTNMPKPEQLPESLKTFAFINAAPVDTGRDFHRDLSRVLTHLSAIIGRCALEPIDVARKYALARISRCMTPLAHFFVCSFAFWSVMRRADSETWAAFIFSVCPLSVLGTS